MNQNKKRGRITGLLFVLAGIFLIIGKIGIFGDINLFNILITIALIICAVGGLIKKKFGRCLFSMAFLYILYEKYIGIPELTPITVLVAALFGTIGLHMIFGDNNSKHKNVFATDKTDTKGRGERMTINIDGEETIYMNKGNIAYGSGNGNFKYENIFGSTTKYVNSNDFESATISNVFGNFIIYLEHSSMLGNQATVSIDNAFSTTKLFIPKHWKVIQNVDLVASNVKERGYSQWCGQGNTLFLNGDLIFATLEIIYI